jgi:hypothetical protein
MFFLKTILFCAHVLTGTGSSLSAQLVERSLNLPILEEFRNKNKKIIMMGDSSSDAIIFTYEGAHLPDSLDLLYHGQKVVFKKNMNEMANGGYGGYGFCFQKIKTDGSKAVVVFEYYPTWVDPKRFSYWTDRLKLIFTVKYTRKNGAWEVTSCKVKNPKFKKEIEPEEWLKENYVPIK